MPRNQVKYIPKLNDRDVVRAFLAAAKTPEAEGLVMTFTDLFGNVSPKELPEIEALAGMSLNSASLQGQGRSWTWHRLKADPNNPHSAAYDSLTFAWDPSQWDGDRLQAATISSALDTALNRPLAAVSESLSPLAAHSEALLAMESIAANIITEATNHRLELDRSFSEKEEALTNRIAEDRERELQRIESERLRIEAELSVRQKELDNRKTTLDEIQRSLDDRNNTHVRRQIRESLLNLAKERLANFNVSKETRTQYLAVHAVSLAGLALLISGSANIAAKLVGDAPVTTTLTLAIKSGALAAAALALGSWYLGWLNRWLQRIADAEFKLQQFRLDIERASWLAETVLEWKSTSSEPFPELLATRLSTGLFSTDSSATDDPKTPAAQLAEALFGAAASAKLKMGDQELLLDRKAIRKLESEPKG